MNILQKIDFILHQYRYSRACGHTHAAAKIVKETPGAVMIINSRYQALHLGLRRDQWILLDDLDKLRGSVAPIVWDNWALEQFLREMRDELTKKKPARYLVTLKITSNDSEES